MDWLMAWLLDWRIDSLMDEWIDGSMNWWIHEIMDWSVDWLIEAGTQDAPRRHPRAKEAPRKHPEGIQEAARRHPQATQKPKELQNASLSSSPFSRQTQELAQIGYFTMCFWMSVSDSLVSQQRRVDRPLKGPLPTPWEPLSWRLFGEFNLNTISDKMIICVWKPLHLYMQTYSKAYYIH